MKSVSTVKLSDGRNLAYAQYGCAEGRPVIAFHGTPGSRLEHAVDSTTLEELNIRLITVDRPGYGFSDFKEERSLLDWPDDVSQLADALLLEHFSITGYSGGGAYAAACAHKIPDRLAGVALLSSVAPYDAPEITNEMMPASRALFELAANDFQQAIQHLSAVAGTAEALFDSFEASLPTSDKTIFSGQDFHQMYKENLSEALRQGLKGVIYDMSLIAQPWGFNLSAINTVVHVWHGKNDITVPAGMAQYLANTIPQCHAHFFPDEGHLMSFKHWRTILKQLTTYYIETY